MSQGSRSASDTEPDLARLGRELQREREDAKIDQLEAAQQVGISRVTLSRYENGKQRAPHDVIVKLRSLYARHTPPRVGSAMRVSERAPHDLPRQLERLALSFEQEMLESSIDDEFIRYARRRMRDPELLEMYAGGHVERPMTAEEQLDDFEDLIDELRGRLHRRIAILKKGGPPA